MTATHTLVQQLLHHVNQRLVIPIIITIITVIITIITDIIIISIVTVIIIIIGIIVIVHHINAIADNSLLAILKYPAPKPKWQQEVPLDLGMLISIYVSELS